MIWYEHLLGILAVLYCVGMPLVLLVVWSCCAVSGQPDKREGV